MGSVVTSMVDVDEVIIVENVKFGGVGGGAGVGGSVGGGAGVVVDVGVCEGVFFDELVELFDMPV
ncbi:hypothetical protein AGMMS49950_08560 [Endomicrobiia bacterium]|nr:hypothetical protein AGMMS49950_08560 [Endomicrobiia bacterium]